MEEILTAISRIGIAETLKTMAPVLTFCLLAGVYIVLQPDE